MPSPAGIQTSGRRSHFHLPLTMIIPLRHALASALIVGTALFIASVPVLHAHDEKMPAHDASAMKPTNPAEAWGVINGLHEELATQIAAKNLKPVHETAERLTATLVKLREASKNLPADKLKRVQGAVANLAKALDGAHNAADEGDQAGTEEQLKAINGLLRVLAAQYPADVSATKPVAMKQEDHAHMGGGPGEPTVRVAFMPAKTPEAGVSVPVAVKLTTKDGKLVTSADLELAHTKLVHLLIVDSSLTSYTHEHPVETAPGEWSFTFNPRAGGTYTVFADLLPKATGAQEYAKTTVTVAGAVRPLDTSVNQTAIVDGYRYDLKIPADEPLTAGAASLVSVHVTKPDGTPATNLEPIMAAFAHGVGFTADLTGVLHVHPMGKEPKRDSERGGPDLSFHLQPAMPGFFKFYVQVQIDGQSRFAGFGLNAAPARPESTAPHHDGMPMTYVCPMHPEVTSAKTGDKCPKCGMALVLTPDASPAAGSSDHDAVKTVLAAYNHALTSLGAAKAKDLFTADSAVFESGGVEGTFAHYLEHHIGPELAEFNEFSFRDYKVDVRLEPPLALATETYIYKIVLKPDGRVIEKRGVATSVLKKIADEWRIIQTHTSSRNLPKKAEPPK